MNDYDNPMLPLMSLMALNIAISKGLKGKTTSKNYRQKETLSDEEKKRNKAIDEKNKLKKEKIKARKKQ